jgi:hypothetical protein
LRDAKNKLEKWKSERDFPARMKGKNNRTVGPGEEWTSQS